MNAAILSEIEQLHEAGHAWALACCRWDRAEAEDVLQTVYVKVLDGRARFDGRSALKTWLFAVIRKTAADRRRRAWMLTLGLDALWSRGVAEPATAPDEAAGDGARVRRAVAALAPRQREVINLVFFHGLTVEEAAGVMGVSLGSARVHYDRGKRRLAEVLA